MPLPRPPAIMDRGYGLLTCKFASCHPEQRPPGGKGDLELRGVPFAVFDDGKRRRGKTVARTAEHSYICVPAFWLIEQDASSDRSAPTNRRGLGPRPIHAPREVDDPDCYAIVAAHDPGEHRPSSRLWSHWPIPVELDRAVFVANVVPARVLSI